jgi:hypothetical protein
METRIPASKGTTESNATFLPIPDLGKMSVGHAGLYPDDNAVDIEAPQVIDADIPLGIKGGKTLIDCEKGIKSFVKDELAGDKNNGLPNTETGVWVYYLTQGIMRDYGRTWEKPPVSIKEKATSIEKARNIGKRVLSKKEKNELIARRSYEYWEQDILDGKITEEEADMFMKEARDKVRELQEAGFFVSTRKTEGVALFDWRSEVVNAWDGDETKLKIYTRHSIIPVVPCLVNKDGNKFGMQGTNRFVKKEIDKSIIAGISLVSGSNWMENQIDGWKKLKEHYEPKTFHIAKINQSGKMKDRWFVADCIKKSDGKQVLLMWDKNGKDGMLE